ncbi:pilus assembly protein N-terminal domain-containing protein [Pyxidicoccus sp. 3LG]
MRHGIGITLFTLAVAGTALAATESDKSTKAPAAAQQDEVLALKKGGAHRLRVKDLSRVALGDPEIAEVELSEDDSLRITPRKAGETTLIVWSGEKQALRTYRIIVRD